MTDFFTADFYSGNRQRLSEKLGSNLIVIAANGLLQRSADTTYAFRQDSNFWYLTGVEEPDFVLVINGTSTFLIAPKRADHRDLWDGAIDKGAIRDRSGIQEVEEHHDGWVRLDLLIKKYKKIHTIAPAEPYLEHFGFYANPARAALLDALKKHRKAEIVDIRKQLAYMRQIKQEPELRALKQAIKITGNALDTVRRRVQRYKYEYEVAADITREFMKRGVREHAYQPIIACGQNATTIHYIDNNQPINTSGLLLLDVGAEVCNYSADITRTFAISEPTKRQRAVYEAVIRVQQAAFDRLKPGVDMKQYEQFMDEVMANELKKLGLLDDIHDKKKIKKYYPHLTSHFLGLDTHDAADYAKPLEPGMVLTVEPGIYIPEEGIGIRIEDDVLVTETGIEVLSSDLSAALD